MRSATRVWLIFGALVALVQLAQPPIRMFGRDVQGVPRQTLEYRLFTEPPEKVAFERGRDGLKMFFVSHQETAMDRLALGLGATGLIVLLLCLIPPASTTAQPTTTQGVD